MSAENAAPVADVSPQLSLIDVLSVPTVGAAVVRRLQWLRRGVSALRQTCSALCALVDQHIETLRIHFRGQEDAVLAGRLARKAPKPHWITLDGGYTDSSSSAMAALLAPEQQPMFQRVQHLTFRGRLPVNLPHEVFVSMPLLTHLTLEQELTGQTAQMLAAVQFGALHSLSARMDLCHAWLLQGCTQLKALTLTLWSVKGASAIAQLTGLTRFELFSATDNQLHSAAEQSELGSALAALGNLQHLHISHAPPGPVSQALSQLTCLTELELYEQDLVHNPGPLVLPSCVKLNFHSDTAVQHIASIDAPQLQHLDVMQLALTPSDLDALRGLCRGVLRACGSLTLDLRACFKEDTVALMAVLSQGWQPSAEALQPIRSSSIDSHQAARHWSLELCTTPLSRQCLELLPKGLSVLNLRGCTLDPDSLDPLAQLASLRDLVLYKCIGVTIDALERLLSTSVQGCLLKVIAAGLSDTLPEEACTQMRQRVVAQRGSRDTPVLEIW